MYMSDIVISAEQQVPGQEIVDKVENINEPQQEHNRLKQLKAKLGPRRVLQMLAQKIGTAKDKFPSKQDVKRGFVKGAFVAASFTDEAALGQEIYQQLNGAANTEHASQNEAVVLPHSIDLDKAARELPAKLIVNVGSGRSPEDQSLFQTKQNVINHNANRQRYQPPRNDQFRKASPATANKRI
jgi:hypothetical protein